MDTAMSEASQHESDESTGSPKPSFCNELSSWSAEYLASPRGLVAKLACLDADSNDRGQVLESINNFRHEDLLPLFSNELKQFMYLIYKNERSYLQKRYARRNRVTHLLSEQLNSVLYPVPEHFDKPVIEAIGEQGKFQTLPQDNAPCAPMASPALAVNIYSHYLFASYKLVRFPGNTPEINFQKSWLNFTQATDQQLLEVSPLTLLAKYHHFEVLGIVRFLQANLRVKNAFIEKYLNSLGVIPEAFPWYFRSDIVPDERRHLLSDTEWSINVKLFLHDVCYPLYHAVLSLSKDVGAILPQLTEIYWDTDSEYSLRNLYHNALEISGDEGTSRRNILATYHDRNPRVPLDFGGVFSDVPLADDYPFSITDVVLKVKRGDFAIAVFGDIAISPTGSSMDANE